MVKVFGEPESVTTRVERDWERIRVGRDASNARMKRGKVNMANY